MVEGRRLSRAEGRGLRVSRACSPRIQDFNTWLPRSLDLPVSHFAYALFPFPIYSLLPRVFSSSSSLCVLFLYPSVFRSPSLMASLFPTLYIPLLQSLSLSLSIFARPPTSFQRFSISFLPITSITTFFFLPPSLSPSLSPPSICCGGKGTLPACYAPPAMGAHVCLGLLIERPQLHAAAPHPSPAQPGPALP